MNIFKRHEMKDRRYMKTWKFDLYFSSLKTRSSWAPRKFKEWKERKKWNVSETKQRKEFLQQNKSFHANRIKNNTIDGDHFHSNSKSTSALNARKGKTKVKITRADYGNDNENWDNRPSSPLLNRRPLSDRKNRKRIGKHGKKDSRNSQKTEKHENRN